MNDFSVTTNRDMDWLKWDQQAWELWFYEKLHEKEQIYKISPDDLIASYNREVSHTKEYHGRELLELIKC